MNGVHDMGGMHGFGRIEVEQNEPVFHARWNARIFGIRAVARGQGMIGLDESRHVAERLDPADYLSLGYYGRWLRAFENLLIEDGWIGPGEVDARIAGNPFEPAPVPNLPGPVREGGRRHRQIEPRFAVGERVVTRNHQPPGHTRLAAYARTRRGEVATVHPWLWVFPDSHAHRKGEAAEPVYSVRFAADELWGESAEHATFVYIDLFEIYLNAEGDDERPRPLP